MRMSKPHHKYFQSKFNRELVERFEIEESIIGFDHNDFRKRILDELSYLGMEYSELASKCYVGTSRITYLMNTKNSEFLPSEIKSIKKILGM
jgi:hypothetical protein